MNKSTIHHLYPEEPMKSNFDFNRNNITSDNFEQKQNTTLLHSPPILQKTKSNFSNKYHKVSDFTRQYQSDPIIEKEHIPINNKKEDFLVNRIQENSKKNNTKRNIIIFIIVILILIGLYFHFKNRNSNNDTEIDYSNMSSNKI